MCFPVLMVGFVVLFVIFRFFDYLDYFSLLLMVVVWFWVLLVCLVSSLPFGFGFVTEFAC